MILTMFKLLYVEFKWDRSSTGSLLTLEMAWFSENCWLKPARPIRLANDEPKEFSSKTCPKHRMWQFMQDHNKTAPTLFFLPGWNKHLITKMPHMCNRCSKGRAGWCRRLGSRVLWSSDPATASVATTLDQAGGSKMMVLMLKWPCCLSSV